MSSLANVWETREFAYELKFVVDLSTAQRIRDWARLRLQPDPNSETEDGYRVTSLYFDTPRFDVFHRRGSFGRGKYRVRRYGCAPNVFLERKLKTRSMVTKRRSLVDTPSLHALEASNPISGWTGAWFHRRLLVRGLRPIIQISYNRTARVEMTSLGPVRLTIDEDLRASGVEGPSFQTEQGEQVLPDKAIVELKFRRSMPSVFKEIVHEFGLTPASFSKYRTAAQALEFVKNA
jgi:hypothetical protein